MTLGPLALIAVLAAQGSAQESCAVCHGDVGHVEADAVHAAAGIGCVDCHGGAAGVLELPAAHGSGVHVVREPRAQVELCGGCHADQERMRGRGQRTDQLLQFRTSAHGLRLAEADDPDVATCTSCHGAHGVLGVLDPRSPAHPLRQLETCGRCHADEALMGRHGLSADAPHLYRESVHGRALHDGLHAAPSCTACHGSHGATPPRVDEVGNVCGRCHTAVGERFAQSPHFEASRAGKLEQCVSCHGSHAVAKPSAKMLAGDEVGHCGHCHAGDPEALALGADLYDKLFGFDASLASAASLLARGSERGIFVEPESDRLREARALRSRAGPVVHTLSVQALDDLLELGHGMLEETFEGVHNGERQLWNRKVFVLVFLVVDLLLAAMLIVHAREVAGRATGTPSRFDAQSAARGRRG